MPYRGLVVVFVLLCVAAGCDRPTTNEAAGGPPSAPEASFPSRIEDDTPRPVSGTITVAPVPVAPVGGVAYDHTPRHTVLTWRDVEGAGSYIVEVEYCQQPACPVEAAPIGRAWVTGNAYAFDFVGANPGRWRVAAIDPDGASGPPSAWETFVYRR